MIRIKQFLVSVLSVVFTLCAVSTVYGFYDTDGHWAENTIEKWQDYGYISGYPDGSFKPDNPVTRAELAKILSTVFDLQQGEPLVYTDISDRDWFYPYLEKSAQFIPVYALPTSYDSNIPYRENESRQENCFLPNVNAIRMHVAEALTKIKLERENTAIEDLSIQEINEQVKAVFKDPEYSNLSAMHGQIPKNVERMNRYTWLAYKLNIMIGDDENFDPYGYITRAELLTAIDRMNTVHDDATTEISQTPGVVTEKGNQSYSLLNEYAGLNWNDSLEKVCDILNDHFEFDIITSEDSEETAIKLLNSTEYQGMKAEKFLRFNTLDTDEKVLTSITYAFDDYNEVYTFLENELGVPDQIDNQDQSNERVRWDGSAIKDMYPYSDIEKAYQKRNDIAIGETGNISIDEFSRKPAEILQLWNINGDSGYLIDDGSYIAIFNNTDLNQQ